MQAEFNALVGKLAPLLKRIEATDKLIDQIVYRLYGLTDDEIRVVEENISNHKDSNTKEEKLLVFAISVSHRKHVYD